MQNKDMRNKKIALCPRARKGRRHGNLNHAHVSASLRRRVCCAMSIMPIVPEHLKLCLALPIELLTISGF
jgi:hypothetical protein